MDKDLKIAMAAYQSMYEQPEETEELQEGPLQDLGTTIKYVAGGGAKGAEQQRNRDLATARRASDIAAGRTPAGGMRSGDLSAYRAALRNSYEPEGEEIDEIDEATKVTRIRGEFKKPQPLNPLPKSSRKSGMEKLEQGRKAFNKSKEVASRNLMRQKSNEEFELDEADSVAAMRERAAKRRQQRYGKQGGGGRDDFRPYTKADYERGEKESTKKESFDIFDTILEYLVAEGYADTNESALVIMANMSEEWRESIVEEVLDEGEKPFPYEKVTAQQKKHTAAGRYGNMMKMGLAKRRAKEADKRGGSQQDAGKGWYHGR